MFSNFRTILTFIVLLGATLFSQASAEEPGLLEDLLGAPNWRISADHRTRFEIIDGASAFMPRSFIGYDDFRLESGADGAGAISLRTSILVEGDLGRIRFGAEFMDSRTYTPYVEDTSACFFRCSASAITNAVEPLQGYVAIRFGDDLNQPAWKLMAGRFTMNIGSGRLVARHQFRNTTPSFYGLKADINIGNNDQLTVFYTLPAGRNRETENEALVDRPRFMGHFFGGHYTANNWINDAIMEMYVYGRFGVESPYCACRRNLNGWQVTPGARLYRTPKLDAIDFDFEFATHIPTSSYVNHSGDARFAYFAHAEIGKTFDIQDSLRLSFLADIASGSKRKTTETPFNASDYFIFPADARTPDTIEVYGREFISSFETLFGNLENDFGPRGLFGMLSRNDLLSVGLRSELKTSDAFDLRFTYRSARKMEPRNRFTGIASRMPAVAGVYAIESREFSGWAHQLDARARYWIIPDILQLEFGAALFTQKGKIEAYFPDSFSTGEMPDRKTTAYGYSSISAHF